MGLAASQARFLGITARKSNIEYEGQQVNQQRTALAEEVNALYNKLLSLKLPIAPDTTEFYQSNYSFSVADTSSEDSGDYIIKSYFLNEDGKTYTVNSERKYTGYTAQSTNLSKVNPPWARIENNTKIHDPSSGNDYNVTLLNKDDERRKNMIKYINSTIPNEKDKLPADTNFYIYQVNGQQVHYIVDKVWENPTADIISYVEATEEKTEAVTFDKALITFDSNNRMNTITLEEGMSPLNVGTSRTYDTEGYDKALRDYTMSKDEYDKKVADLNAQTESLQQEDKVLELRLNQIDTEQNELQTELEAVKAVLDKNIENTFKTFA